MYQVLTSTNLSSWNAVASPTAGTNGLFSFLDPIGSASAKFYRAVWP
jgi:hypothetical protein